MGHIKHIKGEKIFFLQSTVLISAQTPKFGEPTQHPAQNKNKYY